MNLKLRQLRKAKGLRQEDLAEAINSTPRIVGAWERQETALPLEDACLIADVLRCTLDELAGRVNAASSGDEGELIECFRAATRREKTALLTVARTYRDGGLALNGEDAREGIA